ncbi:INTS7 [Acanthosepion pharaonis]|uniref:Integrator complex subunit 7 n=1 Tax=Acanthosepion pharaonis TaxID=158019 RepID=A0A812BPP9_ACAPH|nr:INTS7 [Sepia pharaonis]
MACNGNTRPYESNTTIQEQDANSALTELDKGLRSQKLGDQCEAVVRFPRLFEKYPFPILINSAVLKLAEVFRAGSNFIRLCILRVTQQAEKHLDKVLNVDDFIRRIFSVMHSNDPIARAITLRTLGSIAPIIAERKNVHHSIVVSLDSHDAIEVDAAVYAAERFAARSKTFSASICDRIAEMIERVESPVDLKLKLIPILQHMHHDAATATKAREVCLLLLQSYPARNFIMLTLHSMSQLAAYALLDIPHQVSLLLNYLEKDPRQAVKKTVLRDLQMLAIKAPHLWTAENIEVLCRFVLDTPFVSLKEGVLYVLTSLSSSISMYLLPIASKDSLLVKVCKEYCYHEDLSLASKTVELLTHLTIHPLQKGQNNDELVNDTKGAIQTVILLSVIDSTPRAKSALKLSLMCAVKMCQNFPALSVDFVDTIASLLQSNSGMHQMLICDSLTAIGATNCTDLESILPLILDTLKGNTDQDDSIDNATRARICTLVFQMACGKILPTSIQETVITAAKQAGAWEAYRVVRQAMRYRQYHVAVTILASIMNKVASEHFHFWLSGLYDLCVGESQLLGDQDVSPQTSTTENVGEALTHYQRGISQLKAATTPSFRLHFQNEYSSLRCQLMQQHRQLCQTCGTFQTCPPPAIASALAMNNSSDISRCGPVISQLTKCQSAYTNLSQKLMDLYQSSFDADPASLSNIQLLHLSSELMKTAISTILQAGQTCETLSFDKATGFKEIPDQKCPVNQQFCNTLHAIADRLYQITNVSNGSVLTHKHMAFLCESAEFLIQTSLGYPRYFFQSLQMTEVKLAISPQPHNNMDPVSVQHDTHLALKVEGVIQHGNQPNLYRRAQAVTVNITSELHSHSHTTAAVMAASGLKNSDLPPVKLSKTLEPQNDYFISSFLLALPVPGLYSVTIEAYLVDENGFVWKTGPRNSLMVKCFDDILQQRQQNMRNVPWNSS